MLHPGNEPVQRYVECFSELSYRLDGGTLSLARFDKRGVPRRNPRQFVKRARGKPRPLSRSPQPVGQRFSHDYGRITDTDVVNRLNAMTRVVGLWDT